MDPFFHTLCAPATLASILYQKMTLGKGSLLAKRRGKDGAANNGVS